MTPTARLIVCERTGQWASALRRDLSDHSLRSHSLRIHGLRIHGLRIHETRNLDDAWNELRDASASLVIVEATRPRLAVVVTWLLRLGKVYPQAKAIVVGGADLVPAEWVLREAGAPLVHGSLRDPANVLRVALRHLAGCRLADRTWREQWFDRLPWSEPDDPA